MKKSSLILAALALSSLASVAVAQSFNASGATFPAPIYGRWFQDYKQAHPSVQINYQPNGSGSGITDLINGTVDFAASDRPLTADELNRAKNPIYFPTVLGAVVIAYNMPALKQPLKLTPEVLANIFLTKINKWNDPAIAKLNPGAALPNEDIVLVHRSDGSGTTFVFTEYLSKISDAWKNGPGTSQSPKWPGGLGQPGNPGVAGEIKKTKYSIGYVELAYVLDPSTKGSVQPAQIQNAAGQFVTASVQSVAAAGADAKDFPVSLSNPSASNKAAYPISTFTYLLIPSKWSDPAKRGAIVEFLKWMLTTGQKSAPSLFYAPLPAPVVKKDQDQIAKIQ